YIAGTVVGNIFAKESIVLSDHAVVRGDIRSNSFNIASGAVVDGTMLQANRNVRDPQQSRVSQTNVSNESNSLDRPKQ
ncbi:MAG: polymer-forming cytoskeletal protein, partial [Polynucleobacter victoriensis]